MKAFIDLLTEEQDCLRNIKIADEAHVTLNNIAKDHGLTSTQDKMRHYYVSRITELASELPRIQAEIGNSITYYLRTAKEK